MSSTIQNNNLRDPSPHKCGAQDDTRLKIGIDASRSIDSIQKTGVEKVSDELIKEIRNQKSEIGGVEIIYYTPKKIDWLSRGNQKILNWPLKFLWTQIRLGWELLIHQPNVFFSPVHTLPFMLLFMTGRDAPRRVSTIKAYKIIHDLAFKKHPELYTWWQKLNLNLDLWLAKKVCAKIFVPTQAVKDDLLRYTKISADKVVVIHHGYHPVCHSDRSPSESEGGVEESLRPSISEKRRDPSTSLTPFAALGMTTRKKQILYIGRVEEKKNINNLIKAFEIFIEKYPDYKLILAGPIIHNSLFIIHNSIKFPGYVAGEQKERLLRESACLVLVSKEEGFGFPLLEGFDFGLPVLASNIPVLREVGGAACLYVNPESPAEIAAGLEKIISDENLRQNLIGQGREQLRKFNWKETAEKYLSEF